MSLVKVSFSLGLATALVLVTSASANASILNSETCIETTYYCVNSGSAGLTGYAGSDGPYAYDSGPGGASIPHNCTSYVAYRFGKVMGYFDSNYNHLGDAADWDVTAIANVPGTTFDDVPQVGDVAQWDWGHVAWVDRVEFDANGNLLWIAVSDDNYNRKVTTRKKIYPGIAANGVSWPSHFIRFPIFNAGGGGLAGGGGHYVAMNLPLNP